MRERERERDKLRRFTQGKLKTCSIRGKKEGKKSRLRCTCKKENVGRVERGERVRLRGERGEVACLGSEAG